MTTPYLSCGRFDLRLHDDQLSMLDMVSRFTRSELQKLHAGACSEGHGREHAKARLAELGLDQIDDQSVLMAALIVEEVSRGDFAVCRDALGAMFHRHLMRDAPVPIEELLGANPKQGSAPLLYVRGRSVGIPFPSPCTLSFGYGKIRLLAVDGWDPFDSEGLRLDSSAEHQWASRAYDLHVVFWTSVIVGCMRRGLEAALEHVRLRRSFGKPLLQHQAVAIRLADMAIALDGCKLLAWQLARQLDGETVGIVPCEIASYIAEAASRYAADLVQLFGAHAYVRGTIAFSLFKDLNAACRCLNA